MRPEPATGFTLYTDAILATLPDGVAPRRLLLPLGAPPELAATLRGAPQAWITVAALAEVLGLSLDQLSAEFTLTGGEATGRAS